ncbi:uncharacterized protein LOC128264392 [Drosophila gunungcola]|uniref:uncharacterized protein LOC128264392 n=1 Tax=Drosophila gunungcola TaxID=103775 RepID=UPI0022E4E32C|nr:uncharacterized protein LOC128264392 [Drosophila gunungcola]
MDQLKLLKAERSHAKASITRLLTASQDPRAGSPWELDEITVSLDRLNTVWKELALFDEKEGADVSILRKVTDGATEIVRGLDAAGQTNRDCWVIHFILAKIDAETRRKWFEGSRKMESPTVDDLLKFLDRRCEEFELSKSEPDKVFQVGSQQNKAKRSSHALVSTEEGACVKCNSKEHKIFICPKFMDLSVEQRRTFVKAKSLCFNCLKFGHVSRKCESKFTCRTCHNRHHSLLHVEDSTAHAAVTRTHSTDEEQCDLGAPEDTTVTFSNIARVQDTPFAESSYNGSATTTQPQGLRKSALPTALVLVRNAKGSHTSCRVLLDSGSELSYISERCVQALGLARLPSRILVSGTSSIKAETTRGCSALDIQSRISEHTMKVGAHVPSKITSTLARHNINASALKAFDGLDLADSDYQSLAPVDILLGSDCVWTVFTGKKLFDSQGKIIAISTIFGRVITSFVTTGSSSTTTMHTAIDINASLRRFWELEDGNQ